MLIIINETQESNEMKRLCNRSGACRKRKVEGAGEVSSFKSVVKESHIKFIIKDQNVSKIKACYLSVSNFRVFSSVDRYEM